MTVRTKSETKGPEPGSIAGVNPQSGGGVVIVSAVDEHGYELLDLSSMAREKVAHGDEPTLTADADEAAGP